MADRKIVDDTHHITHKRGNGQLRREIWVDAQGQVTRYNLAYVNYALHAGDNGRVVGYDNQHGYHHRHYFGVVAAVEFTGFEDIEDQFQADWTALRSTP
ncbi:transcriptional regulator [Rhodoferax lacus]|uniref:Transcriptional regulator n=2 Tax=Rhodoferax lacus TaxID=2184758 RepID=A0A3E1R6K9_9BURK|nr:transcriptional regulator [Rhodoferax lacus]